MAALISIAHPDQKASLTYKYSKISVLAKVHFLRVLPGRSPFFPDGFEARKSLQNYAEEFSGTCF